MSVRCRSCMYAAWPGLAYCKRHARKVTWCYCHAYPGRHKPKSNPMCCWPNPETRPLPDMHRERVLAGIDLWTPYEDLSEDDRHKLDCRLSS